MHYLLCTSNLFNSVTLTVTLWFLFFLWKAFQCLFLQRSAKRVRCFSKFYWKFVSLSETIFFVFFCVFFVIYTRVDQHIYVRFLVSPLHSIFNSDVRQSCLDWTFTMQCIPNEFESNWIGNDLGMNWILYYIFNL